MRLILYIAIPLVLASGCDRDITVNVPTAPEPVITSNVFEFRVVSNAQQARIRYSNPVDGTNQVTTALPFTTSFRSDRDYMFLSLDATPTSFAFNVVHPFTSVQILVNGIVFRELLSTEFEETVSVSGTWRR